MTVNVAEIFDADIQIAGPDPDSEGTFFVKRTESTDHDEFVVALLGVLGDRDRLILHHRSGFALVRLPYGRATALRRLPWVAVVGGVQFNAEQFAAITGGADPV